MDDRNMDAFRASCRKKLEEREAGEPSLARFDRHATNRRGFFGRLGKAAGLAVLGAYGAGQREALEGLFGRGLLPAAWGAEGSSFSKPGMLVHTESPFNGEFPPHLLDDPITPTSRHFVRNNSGVPARAISRDLNGWKLVIDGEVNRPLQLTMEDLRKFPRVTQPVVLECAGNGRAFFNPPIHETPWQRGAVACSEWSGVRLRDVLKEAGLKSSAVYTGAYGEDPPDKNGHAFSRGIPIDKAMDEHTLIALEMNGEPLPAAHGFPARLIVPGWVGSSMQKWLARIWIRDRVHDSEKMTGYSYRLPSHPPVPGQKPPESDMQIATSWVVKSVITSPKIESSIPVLQALRVRGHAWAGEQRVSQVLVSTDFGIHWKKAELQAPKSRYAWRHWETSLRFPKTGYYEIWARAFDTQGNAQPFEQPWNPKGYLGNVIHRVPITVS